MNNCYILLLCILESKLVDPLLILINRKRNSIQIHLSLSCYLKKTPYNNVPGTNGIVELYTLVNLF